VQNKIGEHRSGQSIWVEERMKERRNSLWRIGGEDAETMEALWKDESVVYIGRNKLDCL
jgi:hypothetical protein